ncbi:MAG: hypothetical protein NVSMB55_00540 [Mycobacteriales bacterium]
MLGEHVAELLSEGLVVLGQSLGVLGPELHDVVVGDEHPTLADDGLLVGGFPLQGGGDLNGLDDPSEGARERTLDKAFEPTLEALQHSHA